MTKSEKKDELQDLIVGHFDGSLSETQERELAAELNSSGEAKQLFLSHMRMEGRLHSLGRDGFLREPDEGQDDSRVAGTLARQEVGIETTVSPAAAGSPRYVAVSEENKQSRFALTISWVVLATVMLISSWVVWPSSVSASTVLLKAQQAAAEMVDRSYRFVPTVPPGEDDSAARDLMVTVRGGGQFVVQPENGLYVMGSDGKNFWMARREGPVFVTADYRSLAPELRRRIPNRQLLDRVLASPNEPLLLEISALLQLIEQRYDIELIASDAPAEHHVRATLRRGARRGASVVDFWADAETGVLLRAEMEGEDVKFTRFELVGTPADLSAEWYHHSQHAPDRPVERLGPAKTNKP